MPSVSSSEHFTEEVYHIFHRGFFFSVFFFPVFRESADMQCPEKNTHTHTNKIIQVMVKKYKKNTQM